MKIKKQLTIKTGKMRSLMLSAVLVFGLGLNVNAQEKTQGGKARPFQLSLVTPLGTNGLDSWNITNKFSVNIIAGCNGGVDGVEFSGFASVLKNNMKGAQFSGFANIVLGKQDGASFSGFTNVVLGTTEGAQLSGFANINKGYFNGFQAAGFANVTTDDVKGFQLSGFSNVTTKQIDGLQIAGFTNYSKGNTKGQLSGFTNVNNGNLKGVQIAGFANVSTGETHGVQIAGFLNIANKLNGTQIGVFNYVNSLEKGVPIGFLSIVKNGYRAFEVSSSETLYGITSFKTGTKQFYNIFSVGVGYRNDKILWGWGYGIGTLMPLKNNWELAVEALSYHINEDEWFTDRINLNNKLLVTTSKKITENISVFGGLSWNVNVSETEDSDGNTFDSSISPWDVFDKTYNNDINVKMYPGFTAGIRF